MIKDDFRGYIRTLFVSEVGSKRTCNLSICQAVEQTITKLSKKELQSTISYLKWERAFLNSLNDKKNPNFIYEVESKRISSMLFSDYKDNIFLRLLKKFDASVALRYEKDIRYYLSLTCSKFSSMSYKVI